MRPFFSVIIPTLNEERYLPKLLEDLSAQTFKEFEVLVVDGRSSDKTKEKAAKFAERLPKFLLIEARKNNVSYQRNLGAKKAQGKYLVFFDADIRIMPTCLEELHVASLKQKFNLATTWLAPDSSQSKDKVFVLMSNLAIELSKSANRPGAPGFNIIVEKNSFLKLKGFREDLKMSEDLDLVIRAKRKNIELAILREPKITLSLRRFRSEGTLHVLRKYAQAYMYGVLRGPITKELFAYPMGGHVHIRRKKRKLDLAKIESYIINLKNLQERLNNLFSG